MFLRVFYRMEMILVSNFGKMVCLGPCMKKRLQILERFAIKCHNTKTKPKRTWFILSNNTSNTDIRPLSKSQTPILKPKPKPLSTRSNLYVTKKVFQIGRYKLPIRKTLLQYNSVAKDEVLNRMQGEFLLVFLKWNLPAIINIILA